MKKHIIIAIGILLILTAIATLVIYQSYYSEEKVNPEKDLKIVSEKANIEAVEIIAKNLEIPWSIVFLPDESILVTERTGKLKKVNNGKVEEIEDFAKVKSFGEGGLMGVELHPEFELNNYIYFMYSYEDEGETFNRVARYKYINDTLSDEKIIIDQIPGAKYHNGGRIKFGPDNYLYITTGDAQNTSLAQETVSLAGKILKVDDNGKPAPDNPFNSEVYSYGHRNPQGITWDDDNNLWQTEHGRSNPTGFDEVNLINKGLNYGWPEIEGDEEQEGMISPHADSGLKTWAPGSAAYLNGSIYFGGLRPETLFQLKIDNNNQPILVKHFEGEFGRIRDVVVGPDKMIYLTTSNLDGRGESIQDDDRIIRIDPEQLN